MSTMNRSGTILHRAGAFARGIRAEDAPVHKVWDAISALPVPQVLPDQVTVNGALHDVPGSYKTVTVGADGVPQFHGTVTEQYAAIGHRETQAPLFSAIADAGMADEGRASWYTTPSRLGGADGHLRVVVYFPESFAIKTGSGETTLGVIGHNSLDGTGGFTLDAAGGVWVCANKNVWGDLLGRVSIRHVGDAAKRVAQAHAFLDRLPGWVPELEAVFKRAGELELPRVDAIPLLVAVGISERPARQIAENLPALLTGPQLGMFDGGKVTLEGLYNAGTAFFSHHYDRSLDSAELGLEQVAKLLVTIKKEPDAIPAMIESGRAKLKPILA